MQNRNINNNNERRAEAPPASRGFSAQLRGASLWDLVQIECLSRSRRSMQVVGEGGVGYLYFDRGRIAHATTAQAVGEAAALEILAWTNGSFQASDRPWPEQPTIQSPLEGLLLRAAQLRDEAAASNLVAFPARSGAAADDEVFEESEVGEAAGGAGGAEEAEEEEPEGEGHMRSSNIDDAITGVKDPRAVRPEIAGDFTVVMRLGPTGAIHSNRGGSEELAETVAYVQRLLQLTGEMLGLGEFSAMECVFVEGRCLIFSEGGGETVALRPRSDGNLQPLRERLGL
ncbi:MAG TPA: DUF4388 domain-containing protein [Polyangia bacterium]|nr:DUF4388 domain-containing protein [Polyangia bacterium]